MTDLKSLALAVAKPWDKSPYYENAEKLTGIFWSEASIFNRLFQNLHLSAVVELACGHGRHSEIVQPKAGKLTLIDVFEDNLEACRKRLSGRENVEYFLGDGYTFLPLPDDSQTSIFCYDAMVHFAPELVQSYLNDARRILKPGGKVLFHHSNYDAPSDKHYGQNPHARNKMTRAMFNSFAESASLDVLVTKEISWGSHDKLDGITLMRRIDA